MKETTHRVSVAEAQENVSYWQVFENIFREQAARVLQRAWRRKKQLPNSAKPYQETLTNNAKLLRFIQEPEGNQHIYFADFIRSSSWLLLNFEDPQLERYLARALRENLITKNDFATATLLNQAKKDLDGFAAQYSFDNSSGPYQLENISYANDELRTEFKRQLLLLPPHEQVYFSVNFSRLREAIFFYECAQKPALMEREKFRDYFRILVKRAKLPEASEKCYLKAINNIDAENLYQRRAAFQLIFSLIQLNYEDCHQYIAYHYELFTQNRKDKRFVDYNTVYIKNKTYTEVEVETKIQSQGLLLALYTPAPQCPLVEMSPNYNPNDPTSPILAMIIPTASAFELILKIINGVKPVTLPYYTVGPFTPRFIRALDETPSQFGQQTACRPVELTHPDIVYNLSPHQYTPITPFMLTTHDLYHVWVNSLVIDKPLIRYLRQLFQSVTGFEMSSPIWKLTDMDFGSYDYIRCQQGKHGPLVVNFERIIMISLLLSRTGHSFWEKLDAEDVNLLIIIDMIKHAEKWEKEFLLGYSLNAVFSLDKNDFWQEDFMVDREGDWTETFIDENARDFNKALKQVRDVMLRHHCFEQDHTAEFYIIAYRLRAHPQVLSITNQLAQMDLKQYLHWDRKSNLLCDFRNTQYPIQDLTPVELATLTKQWIAHANLPEPPAPRPRSGFCAIL